LRRLGLLSALTGAAALSYYATRIEPDWVQVRYVPLKLDRLPAAFRNYTIAHISDIHMGEWMTEARLQSAVELVNVLRPDIIAITGDFVSRTTPPIMSSLMEPLSALYAPDGKFAVLGNHDYSYSPKRVRAVLAECGIVELKNSIRTITRRGENFHVAGVEDVVYHHDNLDAVLEALPEDGFTILLAHEPDFADISAATGRFDLQLSGHTHGGQVRLPFVGMPLLPSYGQRYPSGLYTVGNMHVYTNRGLGMIAPYVRFNAPPEITLFILDTL
jgi:uncharacterized protein